MKKIFFLSIALLFSSIHFTEKANVIKNQEEEIAIQEEEIAIDEATQDRMIKTASFLHLLQKATNGEITIEPVIHFASAWAEDLKKSTDSNDQQLAEKLYLIIDELTPETLTGLGKGAKKEGSSSDRD